MKKKTKQVAKAVGTCVGAAAVSAALLSGCNWFRPEENEVVAVYGPPEYFEDDFDPAANEPEEVYGPPEWFEDGYDPAEELPAPVYGPPEWFGAESPETPGP